MKYIMSAIGIIVASGIVSSILLIERMTIAQPAAAWQSVEALPSMPSATYTAPELIMLLGGVGVLLTGVGAIIVNIIVALKTTGKVEDTRKKTDHLIAAVQEVHTITNSNLSDVKAELANVQVQNEDLRALIQDLKNERAKAALAVALATVPATPLVSDSKEGKS